MSPRLPQRPRKRFGQHFLMDESVLERLVACIHCAADDRLLEIGPGYGALTRYLYGTSKQYLAVEIDRDLIAPLKARFHGLEVLNSDVLRLDLAEVLSSGSWRVTGNLPYNISSPLLLKLFDQLPLIEDMHFMFQRELGVRLCAQPGTKSWGRLSVMTQFHCDVEALFDVPPEAFRPAPKVHSQVVRLVPKRRKLPVEPAQLKKVLQLSFSSRRKRLSNALKSLNVEWDRVSVDQGMRPDQLTVEQFVELANTVEDPTVEDST